MKNLIFLALLIFVNTGCATFKYDGKESEPTIVENVVRIEGVNGSEGNVFMPAYNSGINYFDLDVIKVIKIRNPLNNEVTVFFTCNLWERKVKLPPHTYKQSILVTNAYKMYDKECVLTEWAEYEALTF